MPGTNMNLAIAETVWKGLTEGEEERFKAGDWGNLSDSPTEGIKSDRNTEILAACSVLRKHRGGISRFDDAKKNAEEEGIDVRKVLTEASLKYTRPGSKVRR